MTDSHAPTIPGYTIEGPIGRGGSSQVWRATGPQGVVAIKVGLEPSITARAEWRMLRRHAGPHVVEALDLTTDADGRSCLVLEYMSGGSLDDVVRGRGGLTIGECITALSPIAATMADFHDRACVHGDLTPTNILFDRQGRPAVADLGATRVAARAEASQWATYGFAAPEVVDGEPPSAEADVYSFGALIWFCLTGEPPAVAALRPHLVDVLPDAPAELVDVVAACLAQTPSSRPHARDLAVRLRAVAEPHPVPVAAPAPDAPERDPSTDSITRRLRDDAQRHQLRETKTHDPSHRSRSRFIRRGAGDAPGRSRPGSATDGGRGRRATARRWVPVVVLGAGAITAAAVWPVSSNSPETNVAARNAAVVTTQAKQAAGDARGLSKVGAAAPERVATTSPGVGATAKSAATESPRSSAPSSQEVRTLLECRAQAWASLDERQLSACLAPGSEAMRQDSRAIAEAVARGASYRGLRYTIDSLTPSPCAAEQACVRARITTSTYDVTAKTTTQRVERHQDDVRLTVKRGDAGWRITEWALG